MRSVGDLDHREADDLAADAEALLEHLGEDVFAQVGIVLVHADGPLVYLRLKEEDPARAAEVMELLSFNEGNNSGRGIGCISWDGQVHADQFWRNHTFGNVRQRPFSEIWDDPHIELLAKLKDKKRHVTGRCATCRYLSICGGNFRARAEAVSGDIWGPDPACYLTDDEIRQEK